MAGWLKGLRVRWALTLPSPGWWDGRAGRAQSCLPSWVPGAALPTERVLAMPVRHLLLVAVAAGVAVTVVRVLMAGPQAGEPTSHPGHFAFCYQRRRAK